MIPFLASINREEVERGNFTKYTFSGKNLIFEIDSIETNYFTFKYWVTNKPEPLKKRAQITLTDDFQINLENIHKMRNSITLSLTDKIVHFTIDPQWADTTYIIQDFNSILFMNLLNSFVLYGFAPHVLRHNGKILLIEIKQLKICFLSSNAYLNGNEYQISKQFDLIYDQYYFLSPKYSCYILADPLESNFYYENEQSDKTCKNVLHLQCNSKQCRDKLPHKFFFTNFDSEDTINDKKYF